MPKKLTHAIFILDRSGSMAGCKDATISGYNEQLGVLKRAKGKVLVSCVQFDVPNGFSARLGGDVDVLYTATPVKQAPELTDETFLPRGTTNMLDAVGYAIQNVADPVEADSILVVIVSDGYENASREHTWESVAQLIKDRTAKGNWTFAYIGANQDLADVSKKMSIPIGNMRAYDANDVGTRVMYAASGRATADFASAPAAASVNLFGTAEKEPEENT